MFEIDFELGEAREKEMGPVSIRPFLNLEREYGARWSPMKLDLLGNFLEIECMDYEDMETNTPDVIFDLPRLSNALVTLDLRHIPPENFDWKYGEDWVISFTLDQNLMMGDLAKPEPMPEQFVTYKQPKS